MKRISTKGTCIRNALNFSKQSSYHKFDKSSFDINKFRDEYPLLSPKLDILIENIKVLDETDIKKYNRVYKHVIYTDVKSSASGAKMIAAGLLANGYTNVYDNKLKINTLQLEKNQYNNFALLCSVPIYDKPFSVNLRKNIMRMYNDRDHNIDGKYIRILILDQGFKEGLDVFDVKYVHLFEPLITKSDEKQAIGRSTRYCGQKGLEFIPTLGWPLYVYKYEIVMNDRQKLKYDTSKGGELFIKNSGLNLDKLIFSTELETISRYGAVDYDLNLAIHNFGNEKKKDNLYIPNDKSLKTMFGLPYEIVDTSLKMLNSRIDPIYYGYRKLKEGEFALAKMVPDPLKGGGIKGKKKKGLAQNLKKAPSKKMDFVKMRKYISERFVSYTWDNIKFENKCVKETKITDEDELEDLNKNRLIEFTPTQNFVSYYFNNESINKGLLLWHSVGTGKTCSAIAIASRGFEPHGYTILWVTRHTLKPDIWKNIFGSVCSVTLRRKIKKGEFVPEGMVRGPLKFLSKNWLMPISYKQFSNMLLEKNQIFKEMVKRNGVKDPLRKTLVIIDEAHKLYSSDLPPMERPNLNILKDKIKTSYLVSGVDSVRLLLMTATPYTNNPMDLIKMINLMKEDEMPEEFDDFRNKYLDDKSSFTDIGSKYFLDDISGYISYLNRERDARQFAYPVMYNVEVQMGEKKDDELKKLIDNNNELERIMYEIEEKIKLIKADINISRDDKKLANNEAKEKIKQIKERIRDNKKLITKAKKNVKEDKSQESIIDSCLKKR